VSNLQEFYRFFFVRILSKKCHNFDEKSQILYKYLSEFLRENAEFFWQNWPESSVSFLATMFKKRNLKAEKSTG
jgi:hypothetical protein